MTTKKGPTPRANAEHRAKLICCKCDNKASEADWEAEATATWIAAAIPLALPPARLLAALAHLGRAIG